MTKRRTHKSKEKQLYKPSAFCITGRILAVFFTTLSFLLVFLLLTMLILFHGPSMQARKIFTLTLNETSALKWIPRLYLSEGDYDSLINPVPDVDNFVELPTAPVITANDNTPTQASDISIEKDDLEVIDVKGSTYKGKLMLIHTPSRVSFVSIDSFGDTGITLSSFLSRFEAIACTNAGGFEDEGGTGKGGIPDGIVIQNGKIVYGSEQTRYIGFAGFDSDNILHVGDLTGNEILNMGIINGTNFANGPVLIKDGSRTNSSTSGINPRTAIGQTADGTVILVAIEGRMADSLGATLEDMTDIMEEYGAINAVNMDGGSSSGMYYEGERITRSCSVVGDRPLPTAIIVR